MGRCSSWHAPEITLFQRCQMFELDRYEHKINLPEQGRDSK